MLERECTWNESSGEWDLRCVAYTGNNMRKVNAEEEEDQVQVSALVHLDTSYATITRSFSYVKYC